MNFLRLIDWRLYMPAFLALSVVTLSASNISLMNNVIGAGAANILINVSYSIIAAFIFYLFVDVSKRARDIEALAPFVSKQVVLLKGDVISVCKEITRVHGTPLPDNWEFNKNDIVNSFGGVLANAQANMVYPDGRPATIFIYIKHHADRSRHWLENLSQVGLFLDGTSTACISEIQTGGYLKQIEMIASFGQQLNNSNLSFLVDAIDNHYRSIIQLEGLFRKGGLLTDSWNKK